MLRQSLIELEEGWEIVQKGITKMKGILDDVPGVAPFDSEEYMRIYTTVYNMCTQLPPHNFSKAMHEKYGEAFLEYIQSTVLPSLREKHDEFMLRELVKRWANHKEAIRWMSHFFHYLDRYFIQRHSLPSLREKGLACFRDEVYQQVNANARVSAIGLIEKEREGEPIDRTLLKNLIAVFLEIGKEGDMATYEADFEAHMLGETGQYYSRKAAIWVVEDTCAEYMLKAEECLKREKDRVAHYLHSSTELKLLKKVQHELLVVYDTQILDKEESGCRVLLENDKVEDLSRIYRLYHEIPKGLELVASVFREHVTNEGKALVQQAEEAGASSNQQTSSGTDQYGVVLIRKLIELHDKYMAYVTGCFMNHSLFYQALKEAFEVVCNKSVAGISTAELLAAFCDNILKKGGSKLSEEAKDETLDKVVTLLLYISDKDLFAEFFRKKLTRRLLYDRCENEAHERSILTKLKQQCGSRFTSKMEGMITDLAVGMELQINFGEWIQKNEALYPGINFSVQVLTTGYWPSYKSSDLNLPEEMVKCVEVFKNFFDTKYNRRKLLWIYSLGSCHVEGKFDSKPIELVVTTYQAALLLLFNNAEKLSFSEILIQLNLTRDDLIRLLHSLSCAKYKILVKEPNTKTISQNDTFTFNSKFTDKMRRIKIPLPPVDERKKVTEDVDKDRRFTIEAAIVRIMKSRKLLGHQQLVLECVEMLKSIFKPDIKAIKNRIEDLITREYLERDAENPNTFKYLA